jgi:hypothetical protein
VYSPPPGGPPPDNRGYFPPGQQGSPYPGAASPYGGGGSPYPPAGSPYPPQQGGYNPGYQQPPPGQYSPYNQPPPQQYPPQEQGGKGFLGGMFGGHSQPQQPAYVVQEAPKKHGIGLGGMALGKRVLARCVTRDC